jgi:hypothetical protein
MTDIKLRTTRSLKVTELEIAAPEKEQLAQLYLDPRYDALLDVMERACIQLDTALVNAPTGEPESVLGAHCVSKAGWLFFTYVQKQVLTCYNIRTDEDAAKDTQEPPSLDDILQGVGGIEG